jgi:carotenoid cleavage dioxygenase-like enzyme
LTVCEIHGDVPQSLANGQYVRNGANPLLNEELNRDAHWFDGDGMLTGVLFEERKDGKILPKFVNQWIETDVWKFSQQADSRSKWRLRNPIPPSITTLVNPAASLIRITLAILRTIFIILLSHLRFSKTKIKRISVANTGIYYHDGRALATCESGPPMQVKLPELATVGWFNGREEGSPSSDGFGGDGTMSVFREYTTGHPKVDLTTGEMILFHNTFVSPYTQYSVVSSKKYQSKQFRRRSMYNVAIPGILSPKLMHDFGVSKHYTVILDLPLSLNPLNLLKGKPVVAFDISKPSRFGVFPRHRPDLTQWFEDDPCVIFHTACTWDEYDENQNITAVCMLACRMTNPAVVFRAGNISTPTQRMGKRWRHPQDEELEQYLTNPTELTSLRLRYRSRSFEKSDCPFEKASDLERTISADEEEAPFLNPEEVDQCRLHFFRFPLSHSADSPRPLRPSHSFALSALSLEFPTTAPGKSLTNAHYIYACSTSADDFSAALGKAAKIDILAKVNVPELVLRGKALDMRRTQMCVDSRTSADIIRNQNTQSASMNTSAIQLFQFPPGVFGGEPRFVPSSVAGHRREDDGHLLFFAFDEAQLLPNGEAPSWAVSELWILEARGMKDMVARVKLTQRVPYGLHGEWFDETMIREQRVNREKRETLSIKL